MQTMRRCGLGVAGGLVLTMAAAPLHGGGEIRISLGGGRVTLVAADALLGEVLAEWSRVGSTRFVGVEAIVREPVTLHLVDAREEEAIGLLLRSATGYVAAPRRAGPPGASRYDRVTILVARESLPPARPERAVAADGRRSGEAAAARGPAAPPALVAMEELQRLIDAAAASAWTPPPDGETGPRGVGAPVATTPFPGVGAALRSLPAAPR